MPAGVNVTCLDWGYYGQSYREQRSSGRKKRKRSHNSQEDVIVAYGGSNGTVYMFSPNEGKITGTLSEGHEREVRDFKFLPDDNLEAWSIGEDGKLVQWDLRKDQAIRLVVAPTVSKASTTNNRQIILTLRSGGSKALYPFTHFASNSLRLIPSFRD